MSSSDVPAHPLPGSAAPVSSYPSAGAVPAPGPVRPGREEHDACGVAFVVDVPGRASHDIVEQGLTALRNMEHRGASGQEPDSGDGAGILVQVPDAFYRAVAPVPLPEPGRYAVGTAFLPTSPRAAVDAQVALEAIAARGGPGRPVLARPARRPAGRGRRARPPPR